MEFQPNQPASYELLWSGPDPRAAFVHPLAASSVFVSLLNASEAAQARTGSSASSAAPGRARRHGSSASSAAVKTVDAHDEKVRSRSSISELRYIAPEAHKNMHHLHMRAFVCPDPYTM